MKKIIIYIMVLMVLIISVTAVYIPSDFSRPYLQSKCHASLTGDCFSYNTYALRSTNVNNNMDYTTFTSCNLTSSEFRGFPIEVLDTDSNYVHTSFIAVYSDRIVQIGADCSVQDTYLVNGDILSKAGYIAGGRVGSTYYKPQIGFIYNKTGVENVQFTVLTFSDEDSTLELYSSVDLGDSSYYFATDENFGVAGNGIDTNQNAYTYEQRVWGIAQTYYNDKLQIIGYESGGYNRVTNVSLGAGVGYQGRVNQMLWFEDFNNDGDREFILYGGATFLARIYPSYSAPYYSYAGIEGESLGWGGAEYDPDDLQEVTLCQIGPLLSPLEICYSGASGSQYGTMFYRMTGFDTFERYNLTIKNGKAPFSAFTWDIDGDSDYKLCGTGGDNSILCIDENGNVVYNTTTINNMTEYNGNKQMESFVTDFTGDGTPEILLTSGTLETLNWGGTNTNLTSSFGGWNNSFHGQLYVQDINDDDISELIYIDDNVLTIFSNSDTPFVFGNLSSQTTIVDTGNPIEDTLPADSVEQLMDNITLNIKTIIALLIILSVVIGIATIGVKEPLILILGGVIATVGTMVLGLIGTGILIILIATMSLLLLLFMFVLGRERQ